MIIDLLSQKIYKFISLLLLLYLTIFDITLFNRQVKSEKKLLAATEQDLYLYKGMGAS